MFFKYLPSVEDFSNESTYEENSNVEWESE